MRRSATAVTLVVLAALLAVNGCGKKEDGGQAPKPAAAVTPLADDVAKAAQQEREKAEAAAREAAERQKAVAEDAAREAAEAVERQKAVAEEATRKATEDAQKAAEEVRKVAAAEAAAKAAAVKARQAKFAAALAAINELIVPGEYQGALKAIQETLAWPDLTDPEENRLKALLETVKQKLADAAVKGALTETDEATQKAATDALKSLGGLLKKEDE